VLLLALAAAAGPVGDGKTFELPLPPGDAWTVEKAEGDTKALLRTEFADSDPKATAEVRVMVLSKGLAEKTLEKVAGDWAATIEGEIPGGRLVAEGKSELGGVEAWSRDVRGDWARLTWHLSRKNGFLYVFHVLRTNKAMDDADLEAEVAAMRAGFRYLGEEKPETPRPPEPPPIRPESLPRKVLKLGHWRLEIVKPEGLVEAEKLTPSEMANDVVAKFDGKAEQSVIMIRVYARTAATRKLTLEQLAEQKLKRFEEAYKKENRQPPERDTAWKPPLAERAIRLVLTGRGRTVETTRWFLVECKNERQYQVEIYVAGGDPDRWAKTIEEILDGFRPMKE
jgi:hypothetical protein